MSLILDGTNGLSDVDGTAAAPAIRGTDANTGIFFPAADRIGFAEGGVQVGEFDSSSNFLFNSGYGSVAVAYGCRAWVNFNGTGTVAIRASGNVSSITDIGVGTYDVNYTTALPANMCPVALCSDDLTSNRAINIANTDAINNLTTKCRVTIWAIAGAVDSTGVYVAVFR